MTGHQKKAQAFIVYNLCILLVVHGKLIIN